MIFFYLLIGIMPLIRHPLWAETSIGGLTLYKWVGVCAAVTAVGYFVAAPRRIRMFRSIQAWLFVLFAVLMMGSFLLAGPDVALEQSPVANWVSFLGLFFMMFVLLRSRAQLRWALLWAVGGITFASLHLIREWQAYGGVQGRPGWVTGDPNFFALSAVLCLPIAVILGQERTVRWERLFYLGCSVITLVAMMLASSRGGFLGLVVSGVVIVWYSRDRVRKLLIGSLVVGPMVLLAPNSPLMRLLWPDRSDQGSTDIHIALLVAGFRMFSDHPWTGIGVGNFKLRVRDYLDRGFDVEAIAHNTYMEVGAELGIVGLVVLAGILFFTFRTLGQIRRGTDRGRDPFLHATARAMEAGLAGGCVALFFVTALHTRLLWFIIILAMCLPSLMLRRSRVKSPTRVPVTGSGPERPQPRRHE
jgi:O-antigen ligase